MRCKWIKNIEEGVRVWHETVVIPTYPVGVPDKNPMFLEKRVYQGSSGRVYPHPVIEKIYDTPVEKEYHALCMENKYLFIMVLPELGGRIQRAYDKTNDYDFVYYNQVIKPALVGLNGPWISGGIEFNWPQHHRPSTFDPVDYEISENIDGSCCIIVSEIEQMFRTKGMAVLTLEPEKSYLKIEGRLYNRTSMPQTFLWWANPAVSVNENTQSIFPPDVTAVMDHGKRDVSTFPIATGIYYKQDYSAGVDISRYKNIPVPTSYMAYSSKYDFIGGYDYGKQAGMLHVADHHVSTGKKQWTWGCGDFGKAWDRNLTDEDGPYIELMTGCFTENQPDFTWLMPYEEKTFTQYFLPYKEIGAVKNASIEAAMNLTLESGTAKLSVYATARYQDAKVVLLEHGCKIFSQVVCLSPTDVFEATFGVETKDECTLELRVYDSTGRQMLSYQPEARTNETLPEPAKAVPLPEDVATNEDLYLYGMHLEQYRHVTYLPENYYLEGLRRDQTDARINNAYGLLLLRRGKFSDAEQYFRTAIKKLTRSNPNPYDGEPYYNLGVCLRLQGRNDSAYDSLYKATWSAAQQAGAFYAMACICAEKGNQIAALKHVEQALVCNAHHMKARFLKVVLQRKLGREDEAALYAEETLSIDPADMAVRYELLYLGCENDENGILHRHISDNSNWAIELALDYAEAGFFNDATDILQWHSKGKDGRCVHPMVLYYLAEFAECAGKEADAANFRLKASRANRDYCFPYRLEDLLALQASLAKRPEDANGWYYLGNFWYDKRQYEDAIMAWEKSRVIESGIPTVHRNLSIAYYNKRGDSRNAELEMETAFALNQKDARVLMELDQLYRKLGKPPEERLKQLEDHMKTTFERDDLLIEYIALQNMTGKNEEALSLIDGHRFHPWEGGEGKVSSQYVIALTELAKRAIRKQEFAKAISLLERAKVYPENIGEGKLNISRENCIDYWMGIAYRGLQNEEKAVLSFEKAATGDDEPTGMIYYNDQPPEMIFYQGLALKALGRADEAACCFEKLIRYATTHLQDHVRIDFFAVSLPDMAIFDEDLDSKNRVHCLFMMALGLMGEGETDKARRIMDETLTDPNHQGIIIHRELLKWGL